jgi:hypothetical protein
MKLCFSRQNVTTGSPLSTTTEVESVPEIASITDVTLLDEERKMYRRFDQLKETTEEYITTFDQTIKEFGQLAKYHDGVMSVEQFNELCLIRKDAKADHKTLLEKDQYVSKIIKLFDNNLKFINRILASMDENPQSPYNNFHFIDQYSQTVRGYNHDVKAIMRAIEIHQHRIAAKLDYDYNFYLNYRSEQLCIEVPIKNPYTMIPADKASYNREASRTAY